MRISILITAAALISFPSALLAGVCAKQIAVPDYAPIARAAGVAGDVQLTIQLDGKGQIQSIQAHGPVPMLNEYTKENAQHWQFCTPFKKENRKLLLLYRFRLQGEKLYPPPPANLAIDLGEGVVTITANPIEPQP